MNQDTIKHLMAIHKMHSDGQLTDEEFEALKKQLLQDDTPKSSTSSQQQKSTPKKPKIYEKMDRCDKFLAISIILALIVAFVIGIYCSVDVSQYKKEYVDPSSIMQENDDSIEEDDEVTDSLSEETEDSEDVDYDTEMSDDPDMDESTWSKVETVDCGICKGFKTCRICYGNGYVVMPGVSGFPRCNGRYCNNGKCTACGGTGKATKKTYKDIAIGSNNWRYSKYDKRREAEKLMMRKIYALSNGASANPDNKYGYKEYKNGFQESFGNANGIFLYSIFLCPKCKGKGCNYCYNGYRVTDSQITMNSIIYFVNGKLADAKSTNNPSDESGSSRPQVTGPKQCKFCYGRGYTIVPDHIPVADESDTWFCKECGKHLQYYDYHHHRECKNCGGDGQVDRDDPGYIGN